MSLDLPTLSARARGLSTHLFRRADLEELAGAEDIDVLGRLLARSSHLLEALGDTSTVADLERSVRRSADRRLRVLASWGGAAAPLDVFFAEQDRRSLRALLRGALQGAPSDARVAGLLPTPRLSASALDLLARQPTASKVTAQLSALGHPDAAALAAPTERARPVLLELEVVLLRGFATRTIAAARRCDANLVAVVRSRVDVGNVEAALLVAGGLVDTDPGAWFVGGGRLLSSPDFTTAARAGSRDACARVLRRSLARTELAEVLASTDDPARLEGSAFAHALAAQRHVARREPLGSAPIVFFLMRLEAQSNDLRRIAWGAALGAPASRVRAGLVTPWS